MALLESVAAAGVDQRTGVRQLRGAVGVEFGKTSGPQRHITLGDVACEVSARMTGPRPGRPATVEDADIVEPRPAQYPPSPCRREVDVVVVYDHRGAGGDPPPAYGALQFGDTGQRAPTGRGRRVGAGQILDEAHRNRAGNMAGRQGCVVAPDLEHAHVVTGSQSCRQRVGGDEHRRGHRPTPTAWDSLAANRFDGRANPRWSRSVVPVYSLRCRPRRCNSGTTRSTNAPIP